MSDELERAEKQKKLREQWEGINSFIKMLFKELEEKDKQIEELKKELSTYENNELWALGCAEKKIKELEAQIEKMKSDVFRCFGDEYNVLVAKLLEEWKLKE